MKKKRNLSTLQHVFVLQIKRLCVQSKMHLRLKSNALAFKSKRTCVFYTYLIKHKKEGYTIRCIPPSIL